MALWLRLNPAGLGLFGRSTDEAAIIADQNHIWGDGRDHSWETRSWAELAYWFPAFTVPAGAQRVGALGAEGVRNLNMQPLGAGDEGGASVLSHGYLKGKGFSKVFDAYVKIREKLKE